MEKKKDNWDDIREICDAHDIEMGKMMEIARKKMGDNINGDIKLQ